MSITKKIVAILTVLTVFAFVGSPASAITVEELQAQINTLLAQLATLQTQLAALQGAPAGVTGCTITSFDRNLKQGMSGDDVKCLQIILNSATDTQVATEGAGSPGSETTYFGSLTKAAVIKFQEKYASEILATYGLTTGTGFVGTTTRAKLNTLIGVTPPPGVVCGNGVCETGETSTNCPADCPVTPPVAAGLTAALATDTPAAGSVPNNGNTNFTKFTLTAGSEGDVKISKLYITRTGLSSNSAVENIKIVEADTGTYRGSVGSLNVDNRALITFTPSLTIPKGTTKAFYIRAGIVSSTTTAPSGNTVALGIAASGDITSDASAVNGTFPITGNLMSVVNITIGTATIEEVTLVDSTPDVGDTDVAISEFKVSAGSTEPITIESMTVIKSGTNEASGTNNLELYDVTNSVTLGTVASWDAEDKVTWPNLNIVIGKGENRRFKVLADIVKGAGKTVNCDIVDGSDTLMSVKGNTYGFYITPTRSGSWDGLGTTQTINSGALNISKSAATPATGNITAGSDVKLAVFDFDAKGEDIKITAITLEATLGTMTYDEVTNVKIYDENGVIVTGPKDLTSSSNVAFTDTFIVPIGVHKYTVKAKIADSVSTSDTIVIDVDRPGTSITAKGMSSGDSITATPATDVSANTLTVAAGALAVKTLDTPVARSVAKGTSDFVWATASLEATSSGEDVRVSTISVLDTTSSAADADDIDNMEIWADLTDANSTRGDVFETRVSSAANPSGNAAGADVTTAFTLTQTITVPKGSFKKVALVADLNTGAVGTVGTDSHTFTFTAVTATGATTGSDISETTSGSGQAMTIATSGTLALTLDASSPAATILLGQETSTLAVFRLAETSKVEDLDVDDITLTVSGGTALDTIYLYKADGTLIGAAAGRDQVTFVLDDGTVTVPANGNVKLTVKAKTLTVDGTVVTNGTTVRAKTLTGYGGVTNVVETTGLSSGASSGNVDSTSNVNGYSMKLYKSRPYFSLSASSPASGNLTPQQNQLLAVFDVKAASGDDVTFESGDGNSLTVKISAVQHDTGTTDFTFTLKDEDGNTLDTETVSNDEYTLATLGSITFDFGADGGDTGQSATIPAGQTKKWYVYGDTRTLGDAGDTIQLWLDDATATNVDWGINGSGSYNEADIIFRNDILGPTFTTPNGMSD